MRRDHRPYAAKRLYRRLEQLWVDWRIRPAVDHLGQGSLLMKPWHLVLEGGGIHLGDFLHVVTASDRKVRLSTWRHAGGAGQITLGAHCLLCPGVRIDAATEVRLGDGCMVASGAYLTDADWHDLYDRTRAVGETRPVVLEDNVWVGDSAIVCKGVTIGANSIVGAGAVVAADVPPNVVVVGNPARVLRELDPERDITGRATLFADPSGLRAGTDRLERWDLQGNTWWGWLRHRVWPRRGE